MQPCAAIAHASVALFRAPSKPEPTVAEASPFISCEDELPPIGGFFNFYATLTSVPLLCVPLFSLLDAWRLKGVRQEAPFIHASLLAWLLTLTALFVTNLGQHMNGGKWYVGMHEIMSAIQAWWHVSLINALRRREGWHSIHEYVSLACVVIVSAAVAGASIFGQETHEAAIGITQLLSGPVIVGTHGALARRDARTWRLFVRSCLGLALVLGLTGPHGLEKHLCYHPASAYYHAVVDHACIVCLFGGVAKNAVHLSRLVVSNSQRRKDT